MGVKQMSRSVWPAGLPARDVTRVCIISYLMYVCVCAMCTDTEGHRAKTSPHHIKYLQGQRWLQYQVVEGGLNIEIHHFILNWT